MDKTDIEFWLLIIIFALMLIIIGWGTNKQNNEYCNTTEHKDYCNCRITE